MSKDQRYCILHILPVVVYDCHVLDCNVTSKRCPHWKYTACRHFYFIFVCTNGEQMVNKMITEYIIYFTVFVTHFNANGIWFTTSKR